MRASSQGRSAVSISSRANGAWGEHRRHDTERMRLKIDVPRCRWSVGPHSLTSIPWVAISRGRISASHCAKVWYTHSRVLLWPSLICDVAKLDAQWGDISAADKEMLRFAVALVRSAEPSWEDLAEARHHRRLRRSVR
jgi:hypothetical protein